MKLYLRIGLGIAPAIILILCGIFLSAFPINRMGRWAIKCSYGAMWCILLPRNGAR